MTPFEPVPLVTPDVMGQQMLLGRWVVASPDHVLENGFVLMEAGRIQAVGPVSDLPLTLQERLTAQPVYDVLTPGLINGHTHLELTFPSVIRVLPGESMGDWLMKVLACIGADSSPEAKAGRCLAGATRMLQAGTTTVNDISSDGASLPVLDTVGMRGIVSLEFFHPALDDQGLEPIIDRYRDLSARYQRHPCLTVGLSPHSPYNVSPQAWLRMIRECQPPMVHTHLAESWDEMQWLAGDDSARNGIHRLHQKVLGRMFSAAYPAQRAVDYLERFELLQAPLICAHGVYLSREELEKMARHQVGLAHCPQSNLLLQGKTLTGELIQASGVAMALGTDSALSADSLDVRTDARLAMELHGITARQAFDALTRSGATALRLGHSLGQLVPGYQADVVGWRFSPQSLQNVVEAGQPVSPEGLFQALLSESTRPQRVWVGAQVVLDSGLMSFVSNSSH